MPIDPRRVKDLFNAALDLSDPGDRPAWLDRECGGDLELRGRLGELLATYDHPTEVRERLPVERPGPPDAPLEGSGPGPTLAATKPPAEAGEPPATDADAATNLRRDPSSPIVGTLIAGRYKLRQEIGEGGMGSVYLAEQVRPVRRMVALKLIKPGMDTRNVLARFDSERQALALMDHPHIAKVLDAGSTEQGRPFFVMELVKGIPITEYCDRHQLGIPERLAIFRQVCSAVQHAHQKGIIHRDLKPTNILVEAHDDKPVPKVIDFGLAKATSGMKLTEQSLFTAFGNVTGTPLYMAPEQASFNALDVDTRADIYTLGVILYELLTGSTPIRRGTFQRAALDEMLRVIREDEPPTPSSRIGTSEGLPGLAASRHVEPAKLSRLVRGELDWIVMKALAKERNRRYDSAIGLANDVERHLNHEAVTAGPPTAAYRMSKFVRRNRGQVIAASLVLLALVGGVIGTTMGLIEARRQERRAQELKEIAVAEATEKEKARRAEAEQRQVADEQRRQAEKRLGQVEKMNGILGSIFRDLNPHRARLENKPLKAVLGESLDRATAEIEGEATGDPLAVARMQMDLGRSQLGLGYSEKAVALFTKANATLAARLGPDDVDTIRSLANLGAGHYDAGRPGLALKYFEQVVALQRSRLGPDHPQTLVSMNRLSSHYRDAGQADRSLKLSEEVVALQSARLGPDHPDTLESLHNVAVACRILHQFDRSLAILEEVVALRRARLGSDDTQTLWSVGNLAAAHLGVGHLDRALTLFEEVVALRRARLGPDHPDTLWGMNDLVGCYRSAGHLDRALKLGEETLALRRAKLGLDHPATLASMASLAGCYRAAGQLGRTFLLDEETYAMRRARLGPDHPDTLESLCDLAWSCSDTGRLARAIKLSEELLERHRAKLGADHPGTLVSMNNLALNYDQAGQADRAIKLFEELLARSRRILGSDHRSTLE